MNLKTKNSNLKAKSSQLKAVRGFTLIEILIVVAIIGLLASTIFIGLRGTPGRGRDARRISDLRSIQTGLGVFALKTGAYPAKLSDLKTGGIGVAVIPKDPVTKIDYFYSYRTANKDGYVLGAKLESASDDVIYNNSLAPSDINLGEYTASAEGGVQGCDRAANQFCSAF